MKKNRTTKIIIIFSIIILCLIISKYNNFENNDLIKDTSYNNVKEPIFLKESDEIENYKEEQNTKTITITSLGDCTLGSFPEVLKGKSFHDVMKKNNNDFEYPFKNAFEWIKNDDITVLNFEGTLTDSNVAANKTWRFKGPKEYTEILSSSSIEVVSLANNHTLDYFEKGYEDTVQALDDENVGYYDNDNIFIKEVKGIKIGFLGNICINESEEVFNKVKDDIQKLKKDGINIIICSFHWGKEYNYNPTDYQKRLGRFSVDCGADIVIGHHPHILQGIELYKDKYIAYSLGNFVFGGNEILYDKKHQDTDTILLIQNIELTDEKVSDISISIVPFRLSGENDFNNYQPVVLSKDEGIRVRDKLIKISNNLQYGIDELNIESDKTIQKK